jgi:phage gpG-like protein
VVKFTVKIDGVEELKKTFKLIEKDIMDVVTQSTRDGGEVVKIAAKGHVHVITGRLKNSIDELRVIKNPSRVEVQVGSNVPYAMIEEFRVGGKYPGPHSYMRWALDTHEKEIVSTIENKITSRLARYR